ncbi:ribonuclease HII [Actinocorallia sp. API 0066]|uniref:ribonuclease HII n=1 Tax=Actinocorallia sp. API 0066 TaxID=2896846 RepID=UPI0027DF9C68|nr:ribonuclease HII [Actinocorallia sp. API 0066]
MITGLRRPLRFTPRRDAGMYGYERALAHGGFTRVAGVDEAGRGACAGPLVVAAVILDGLRVPGLADSKLLTAARREALYEEITARAVWSALVISTAEVDRTGVHASNVTGMRRALKALPTPPSYVLSDGFGVPGLEVPSLRVIKGDRAVACIAAASVVAKVTRDRIMEGLHEVYPAYGFDEHKGYGTPEHMAALTAHGPCPEHRFSFVNVRARAAGGSGVVALPTMVNNELMGGEDER